MKKLLKLLFSRLAFVALFMLLQIVVIVATLFYFQGAYTAVQTVSVALALVTVVYIINQDGSSAFKIAWILPIVFLPLFGIPMYILFGKKRTPESKRDKVAGMLLRYRQTASAVASRTADMAKASPEAALQSAYLERCAGAPVFRRTQTKYFRLGDELFPALLEELKKAERFIFLEYFIVEPGVMWDSILDILEEKAAEGLDVRLIYDDLGSIVTTSRPFLERLERAGVRVVIFNPVHRYVHQLYLNYRDHRKIASIDGQVCYTGGVNIGDEYANLYPKHGHWKDTAVRLEGAGAYSLTVFFLQMWQACTGEEPDFAACRPSPCAAGEGYVQPYEDGPYNNPNNTAENVYRQLIGGARRSVYITTPYLVLDETLFSDLCMAARSGVDVRIVIPGIPDHWYVQQVSLSFAGPLLQSGVRIYRYTPGFIHAKLCVADGQRATVGTVNLDYRSFYLHYEDGVLFTGGPVPGAVEADILQTLSRCEELRYDAWRRRPALQKAVQPLLRIFAPMM